MKTSYYLGVDGGQSSTTALIGDATGRVLMVGYMNEEAFQLTVKTGFVTFYSRSRQKLWLKGETSGHRLAVKEISTDCDQDTLLVRVEPQGPGVCHNGYQSCFYRRLKKHRETVFTSSFPFRCAVLSGLHKFPWSSGENGYSVFKFRLSPCIWMSNRNVERSGRPGRRSIRAGAGAVSGGAPGAGGGVATTVVPPPRRPVTRASSPSR